VIDLVVSKPDNLFFAATVLIKKKFAYFTVPYAYYAVLSPYFLLPAQTLQSYFYRTSNATYEILGVVVN